MTQMQSPIRTASSVLWKPAVPRGELDLLTRNADIGEKPVVHGPQFGNVVAKADPANQGPEEY
jgi:hypothetical protein